MNRVNPRRFFGGGGGGGGGGGRVESNIVPSIR